MPCCYYDPKATRAGGPIPARHPPSHLYTIRKTSVSTDTPNPAAKRERHSGRGQKLMKIGRFVLKYAADKQLTQVAASLTFTTVLGVVPLLAVVLSLFTAFPLFDEFRIALERFLTTNLMPPAVSENVMAYLNEFAAKASGLTAIGSLALIVTSIMLIRTIDDAFNSLWHVEHQRPLRQRVLVYWAIISLGPILTGASLWASATMAQQSLDYLGSPAAGSLALSMLPILLTGLGFTGLFMGVPNCRVYWKDALVGGVITAIVLELMRTSFAHYLLRFPSYTVIYGAFATVPIFLLWIYMSWLAILGGAALAALLPAIRQRHWDIQHYPGAELINAVNILGCLWHAQGHNRPGQTVQSLAQLADVRPTELGHLLHTLKDLGYIADSEIDDTEVWLLSCDPRTARLQPLIDALLIDRNQPALASHPQLVDAVATVLAGGHVRLETLFENPHTLAQTPSLRQNGGKVSDEACTKEVDHA